MELYEALEKQPLSRKEIENLAARASAEDAGAREALKDALCCVAAHILKRGAERSNLSFDTLVSFGGLEWLEKACKDFSTYQNFVSTVDRWMRQTLTRYQVEKQREYRIPVSEMMKKKQNTDI